MQYIEKNANEVAAEMVSDDSDSIIGKATIEALKSFWGNEEFEDIILPYVLQLDTPEGKKWLEEHGGPLEILEAFVKAAQYSISSTFGGDEVEEALGKSDAAQQEVKKKTKQS